MVLGFPSAGSTQHWRRRTWPIWRPSSRRAPSSWPQGDPQANTAEDGYTEKQMCNMTQHLYLSGSAKSRQLLACFTMMHGACGRSDDVRQLRLSDICAPMPVEIVRPCKFEAVRLILYGGKTCKVLPDPLEDYDAWLNVVLFCVSSTTKSIAYSTLLSWMLELFNEGDVQSTKKCHASRGAGAREMLAQGLDVEFVVEWCRWASLRGARGTYLTSINAQTMLVSGGHPIQDRLVEQAYYEPRYSIKLEDGPAAILLDHLYPWLACSTRQPRRCLQLALSQACACRPPTWLGRSTSWRVSSFKIWCPRGGWWCWCGGHY